MTGITPKPTRHGGTTFRSRMEARVAAGLDWLGWGWQYEMEAVQLSDGSTYLPDFWVPYPFDLFIEVKPSASADVSKPAEVARMGAEVFLVYPTSHSGGNMASVSQFGTRGGLTALPDRFPLPQYRQGADGVWFMDFESVEEQQRMEKLNAQLPGTTVLSSSVSRDAFAEFLAGEVTVAIPMRPPTARVDRLNWVSMRRSSWHSAAAEAADPDRSSQGLWATAAKMRSLSYEAGALAELGVVVAANPVDTLVAAATSVGWREDGGVTCSRVHLRKAYLLGRAAAQGSVLERKNINS